MEALTSPSGGSGCGPVEKSDERRACLPTALRERNVAQGGQVRHQALTALARDLIHYLGYYNFDRAHTGRKGRVPGEIVYGARKVRPG